VPNKWGGHWPNGAASAEGTGFDRGELWGLGFDNWTILDLQAEEIPDLRRITPTGNIHVRFYLQNWYAVNAAVWGSKCGRRYTQTRYHNGHPWSMKSLGCMYSLANEQNLPDEGGGWSEEWYRRIDAWNLEALAAFLAESGAEQRLSVYPALAYGHYEDVYGYELLRPSVDAHAIFAEHPYWFTLGQLLERSYGSRYEIAHEHFPTKPILCTELNGFDAMRPTLSIELLAWFRKAETVPYLLGGTAFILHDPTGAHRTNDLSRNPDVFRTLRDAQKPADFPPAEQLISDLGGGEMPQTLEEQYPGEYAAWVAAGGIRNNFRAHLLGTGVLQATGEDLTLLAGQSVAAGQQLQAAIQAFPFR